LFIGLGFFGAFSFSVTCVHRAVMNSQRQHASQLAQKGTRWRLLQQPSALLRCHLAMNQVPHVL
jgi:hypothetical protein